MATLTRQDWLSRAGRYPPRLMAAALAMHDNDLPRAEPLLRAQLKEDPFDVFAIRLFAELAGRIGRYKDAEALLRRALELSPAFTAARANLALVLYRQNRPTEAIAELDVVSAEEPDELGHANLQAAAFGRIGGFDEAIALYETVLKQRPDQPKVWLSYGHMLKTVGRQADGIAAYRRAIALAADAWRGVVEPRQPQDRAVRRCGPRGDGAGAARRPISMPRTGCTSTSRSARRSRIVMRRRTRSPTMRKATRCAGRNCRTMRTRPRGSSTG